MRSFADGEKIFGAGEPADTLVVIVRGEIVLRAGGRTAELRRASIGDAIGEESAARAHATRRHDAHATGAVDVALVPGALLRRVIERSGEEGAAHRGRNAAVQRTQRWLVRALASDALERADFARDVPRNARDMMLDAGRAIELRRGDVLHREGDAASESYFVAEGVVRVTALSRRVLAYHRAGDFFGDEAIAGEPRDATVTAASDAWIFAVRADVMRDVARDFPNAYARALRVQTSSRTKQHEIRENATRHVLDDWHRFETSRSLLAIDQEQCVRCGHCAWSCADAHDDGISRLLRRGDVVVAKVRGEARTLLLPSSCQHCKNPACMIDCPTGAIARDARGEVHIREELCTGCGSCVKACPWDNIQLAPRSAKRNLPIVRTESNAVAVKCDLCVERGEPACVAACPVDAIARVDPSADFDDVRAVLDAPRAEEPHARTSRVVSRAVVASSVFFAGAAFFAFESASRRASGFALLALVFFLASYVLVKRFGIRARAQALRRFTKTRAHFIAHLAIGMLTLGVAATHARTHSALAIAFWSAAFFGLLTATLFAVIPKRLACIQRNVVLPEEIDAKLAALDSRVFRDLSGTSDLLKGLYAKILGPYSRSIVVLVMTCVIARSQRVMRDALATRVHAFVHAGDERLEGLEGLVSIVVERQAFRAERVLTRALRASTFVHVVIACGLIALVMFHVFAELSR